MGDDDFDNHPDWGRYKVDQPGKLMPVGDPTKWGAQDISVITSQVIFQPTRTILAVSTRDGYSRSWGLLGTLAMPVNLWAAGRNVFAALECSMGVGQALVTHQICLYAGVTTPGGLCATQNYAQGGPYLAPVAIADGGVQYQTFAFSAIGALVGQSISIRALYLMFGADLPAPIKLNLILTPFAAGEGL
jgi:hypothetical protein